ALSPVATSWAPRSPGERTNNSHEGAGVKCFDLVKPARADERAATRSASPGNCRSWPGSRQPSVSAGRAASPAQRARAGQGHRWLAWGPQGCGDEPAKVADTLVPRDPAVPDRQLDPAVESMGAHPSCRVGTSGEGR